MLLIARVRMVRTVMLRMFVLLAIRIVRVALVEVRFSVYSALRTERFHPHARVLMDISKWVRNTFLAFLFELK